MLRAPETEALDEGTVPLDSTALQRSLLGHIAQEVEWRSPQCHRIKTLWIKRQNNTKQINISDNQQPSGGASGQLRLRVSPAFSEAYHPEL